MSNAHYEPWKWEVPKTIIGERGHIPPDAHTKVVGTAEFTSDVIRPNMLYVKYYIAQRGAGRIKKLDTSKTEQVDGVVKVLRYDDKSIKWASDTLKPGNITTGLVIRLVLQSLQSVNMLAIRLSKRQSSNGKISPVKLTTIKHLLAKTFTERILTPRTISWIRVKRLITPSVMWKRVSSIVIISSNSNMRLPKTLLFRPNR